MIGRARVVHRWGHQRATGVGRFVSCWSGVELRGVDCAAGAGCADGSKVRASGLRGARVLRGGGGGGGRRRRGGVGSARWLLPRLQCTPALQQAGQKRGFAPALCAACGLGTRSGDFKVERAQVEHQGLVVTAGRGKGEGCQGWEGQTPSDSLPQVQHEAGQGGRRQRVARECAVASRQAVGGAQVQSHLLMPNMQRTTRSATTQHTHTPGPLAMMAASTREPSFPVAPPPTAIPAQARTRGRR